MSNYKESHLSSQDLVLVNQDIELQNKKLKAENSKLAVVRTKQVQQQYLQQKQEESLKKAEDREKYVQWRTVQLEQFNEMRRIRAASQLQSVRSLSQQPLQVGARPPPDQYKKERDEITRVQRSKVENQRLMKAKQLIKHISDFNDTAPREQEKQRQQLIADKAAYWDKYKPSMNQKINEVAQIQKRFSQ